MIELVLPGQTPAQKNGKNIGRKKDGGMFMTSSITVKQWQKETLKLLNHTISDKYRPNERMVIDYVFYVKDNRPRDTDNMITSVNDVLQDALADTVVNAKGKKKLQRGTGLIQGDHWQVLKLGFSEVEIDKQNPRAVIQLYTLSEWHRTHMMQAL